MCNLYYMRWCMYLVRMVKEGVETKVQFIAKLFMPEILASKYFLFLYKSLLFTFARITEDGIWCYKLFCCLFGWWAFKPWALLFEHNIDPSYIKTHKNQTSKDVWYVLYGFLKFRKSSYCTYMCGIFNSLREIK